MFDADDLIDFSPHTLGNNRSKEENQNRWNLLLKGLCAMVPGRRFAPSDIARKMIDEIKAMPERYVQWAVPFNVNAKRKRTGLNHYVDIQEYYKANFA